VVVLRNGDRLTGEVSEMERGTLTFKTDDLGTVGVEWDNVASVTAAATFEVEDLAGGQYFGALAPSADPGRLDVVSAAGGWTLEILRVVRIQRLGATLWQRLDGSIDAGVSYTSSSELLKLDLAGRVSLKRPAHEYVLDGSSTVTRQPDVEDTRRNNITATYSRRFPNRWLAFGQGQLEQNRELGFDLRGSVTAGGGRSLVQRRRLDVQGLMGLRLNREKPLEGESTTGVEAAAAFTFDRFSHDFPKVDVYATFAAFASLDDWGRARVEVDARFKRELLPDFTVSLRVYESYDSRPPGEGAEHHDYGGSVGLGWTF
jgi:hypothetical protein